MTSAQMLFKTALVLLAGILLACCSSTSAIGEKKGTSPILLNEIDCNGVDWVEIVNSGSASYEIGGWTLTDSLTKSDHFYAIPDGTTLTAGQHWVVKKKSDAEEGFSFGIKCASDTLYLLDKKMLRMDETTPPAVAKTHTWARYPDATGDWQIAFPTAGSANLLQSPTPDELFTPTSVSRFDITLSDEARKALTADPYTYVEATISASAGAMQVNALKVGLRLKSGKSFQPLSGKASFKIKATSYTAEGRLFGLKGLTLNNMVQDPSMMHETLAYRLFRAYGIAAPRSGYAWVTLNGADYGLELVLEAYDDQFDLTHFSATDHLYEGVSDLTKDAADSFEIEDGATDDTSDLTALIAAAEADADGAWLTGLNAVADVNEMASFWAIEHYIGHVDGYSLAANNYFLHSGATGLFTLHPWGTDRCFTDAPAFGTCTSLLCAKCLATDECQATYRQALNTVSAVTTQLDFPTLIDELQAALASSIAADTRSPYSASEQAQAVTALKAYLAARPQALPSR